MGAEAEGGRERGRESAVEALVAAARRLFAERGPGQVSLREVARAAGVNHGLIHHYIGSKDDLVALVFARAAAEAAERVHGATTAADAMARLRAMPDGGWARLFAHSVLEGDAPTAAGVDTAMDHVAALADGHGGRAAVAAALLQIIAEQLFGDWVQGAVGLGEMERDTFRAEVAAAGDPFARAADRTAGA